MDKTKITADAFLEDLFDVLNGNTEYITLEEFREIYGEAEFRGVDGGSDEPHIRMTVDGTEYDIVMRPVNHD